MVVKLKSYRLSDAYKDQWSLPFLQGLSKQDAPQTFIGYAAEYLDSQISEFDNDYGIIYREVYGTKNGGTETTKAKVVNIDYSLHRLLCTDWTNGDPDLRTVKMDRYAVTYPIISSAQTEEINVSDDVIEDTVEVIRQIESESKFDLRVSRASFSVDGTDSITAFMDKYWNPNGYDGDDYIILVEIEGQFFGFSDFENINYDGISKTYHLDCYDPIKWLQKNIWNQKIPSFGPSTATLEAFLEQACGLFLAMGKTININIGTISQTWSRDYVGGRYYTSSSSPDDLWYTLDDHLNIQDFMVELLKHYGAVLYYDTDGDVNFVSRSQATKIIYTEDDILEELNQSYQGHEYSGLLVSILPTNDWSGDESSGWAFVYWANGVSIHQMISPNLVELPGSANYLDLRQELPDVTYWAYRMFVARTPTEVAFDYRELLQSSVLYETTLDGIECNLYDRLIIDGQQYIINYIQRDMVTENSKVRVYKVLSSG